MAAVFPRNSTIVRSDSLALTGTRLGLGLAGLIAPGAIARHAARLFTTPLAPARTRALQADLGDAKLEFLQVEGEQIALYRWGRPEQPQILFAHGWSSFGLRISEWWPALRAAGYSLVSFDHVGHGRSSGQRADLPGFARTTAAVARALGPLHGLIGHSLGGAAAALALADGVEAKRALLIAPAADALAATQRFANRLGLGPRVLQQMRAELALRAGQPLEPLSIQHIVPALSQSALVIHDLEDREVPWEEGERYARYWSEARLLTLRGLGHQRILGARAVVAAGLRFFDGCSEGERVVSTPALPYGLA